MSDYSPPPDSILEGLRDFLVTYTALDDDAPMWVNYLGETPIEYAIVPGPGGRIVEEYIDGSKLMNYPFALELVDSTADDVQRLESQGFFEAFADWLDDQSDAGTLPDDLSLPSGKTADEIHALGWGYLFEEGESSTGIYQIQCQLIYEQDSP
ncbi:MAG: hypothetical protein SVT56_04950 [Chloroflexota bacterium]|nr:hypothetical protein [Chloroflexota bacterium]